MQLLHPVATFIAKSKLLVLPVYPAAWPQAKRHPLVQRFFQLCRYCTSLYLVQKAAFRYQQMERGAVAATDRLGRAVGRLGLGPRFQVLCAPLGEAAARLAGLSRDILLRLLGALAAAPVIGAIVSRYMEHYGSAPKQETRPSEHFRELFERWSIKFSAEYYEERDRQEAAKHERLAPSPRP
jgi:hypothetical protein